jgi:hypothetical protein
MITATPTSSRQADWFGDLEARREAGRISARPSETVAWGSKDVYLIMRLNQILPREYPRLDLMPEFVWRISDKVKPVFWN